MELVTSSVVVFDSPLAVVADLLADLRGVAELRQTIVVDNSRGEAYRPLYGMERIRWIRSPENLGYGRAHNLAFRAAEPSKYHLVLNPDIRIPAGTIPALASFMESHPDVGLVMPRIVYPDGSTQYLCKLLPTPLDLVIRRFVPVRSLREGVARRLELRSRFDYDRVAEVPWLSGSFMFLRRSVGSQVGLFDERFFLYMEDTDLSRRIGQVSRVVYYPHVTVSHAYQKESYRSMRASLRHLRSAVRYFNKWGWFFDAERSRANRRTLAALADGYRWAEKEMPR